MVAGFYLGYVYVYVLPYYCTYSSSVVFLRLLKIEFPLKRQPGGNEKWSAENVFYTLSSRIYSVPYHNEYSEKRMCNS